MGHIDKQHRQWLSEQEAKEQQVAVEVEDLCAQAQQRHAQLGQDVVATFEVAQDVQDVLAEFTGGGLPAHLSTGIRSLPSGLSVAELRARLASQGTLSDKALEQMRRDIIDLQCQIARFRSNAGSDSTAKSGKEWDARSFAHNFCEFPGGNENSCADDTDSVGVPSSKPTTAALLTHLQQLNAPRLQALALALRSRARLTQGEIEAEKRKLNEDIAKELASHSVVDRVREMEIEIANYRTKIFCEEERTRQLDLALQACDRVATGKSRPYSAGPSAR